MCVCGCASCECAGVSRCACVRARARACACACACLRYFPCDAKMCVLMCPFGQPPILTPLSYRRWYYCMRVCAKFVRFCMCNICVLMSLFVYILTSLYVYFFHQILLVVVVSILLTGILHLDQGKHVNELAIYPCSHMHLAQTHALPHTHKYTNTHARNARTRARTTRTRTQADTSRHKQTQADTSRHKQTQADTSRHVLMRETQKGVQLLSSDVFFLSYFSFDRACVFWVTLRAVFHGQLRLRSHTKHLSLSCLR